MYYNALTIDSTSSGLFSLWLWIRPTFTSSTAISRVELETIFKNSSNI